MGGSKDGQYPRVKNTIIMGPSMFWHMSLLPNIGYLVG